MTEQYNGYFGHELAYEFRIFDLPLVGQRRPRLSDTPSPQSEKSPHEAGSVSDREQANAALWRPLPLRRVRPSVPLNTCSTSRRGLSARVTGSAPSSDSQPMRATASYSFTSSNTICDQGPRPGSSGFSPSTEINSTINLRPSSRCGSIFPLAVRE